VIPQVRSSGVARAFWCSALLVGTWTAPASRAQSDVPPETGFYAGVAAGIARDDGNYVFSGATVISQDLTNPGAKIYAGFRPVRYFGLEIAYAKLGSTGFEGTDANGVPFSDRFTHEAVPLSLVGFLPLGDRWELIGRLGFVINSTYNTEQPCVRQTRWGTVVQQNCPSTPVAWGLGVRYRVGQKWGVRVDYDSYALKDSASSPRAELNFFSVGADYRF
jgi:hypothetical protein